MEVSARRSRHVVSLLGVLALVFALVPAAHATFPGANGKIAFTSERDGNPEIYQMEQSGSSQTRLTTLGADDRSAVWNQTGADLAFASNRGVDTLGDFEIFKRQSDSTTQPLTDNEAFDGSPAWAPGSAQLVIVRQTPPADTDLLILEADGSGAATSLTGSIASISGEVEPDWSSTGVIAFAAFPTGAAQRDIFSINPDGTGLTNLTNTPARDDREPSWSPGGTQITYSSFQNSNYDIHSMNANGSGDTNLTNFPGADDRQPVWSPDGTRIAFASLRIFDNPEIFTMTAGGGSALRLTFSNGPDTEPDWQRVQPPACSDGVDNDGDGQIDFPADPGCTSASDNNETNPACNDGIDNDGDGRTDFPADPGCTSASDNDEFNAPPSGFYVRPKSASPIRVSLVPTFNSCTSPNRTHGPPLAFPSCNPPAQTSTAVTVGTPENNLAPDNSEGTIKLTVDQGTPGPPEDSDIVIMGSVTDVRCLAGTTTCGNANAADGLDYTGQLQGTAPIRITDRWNAVSAGGGPDGATVVDIPFPLNFTCSNTVATDMGGLCTANSSVNAVVPGAIKDGKRSVWEVGQMFVNDGGPDGDVTTVPNTRFMTQGVFVP
jgi:Tol biopolymer transport system component